MYVSIFAGKREEISRIFAVFFNSFIQCIMHSTSIVHLHSVEQNINKNKHFLVFYLLIFPYNTNPHIIYKTLLL